MKFSELEYRRIDISEYEKEFLEKLAIFSDSKNFSDQKKALKDIYTLRSDFETMYKIAHVKNTIDTTDDEKEAEFKYYQKNGPIYEKLITKLNEDLVKSKFKDDLEKEYGHHIFTKAEIGMRTFSPDIMEDLLVESDLSNKYTKLLSGAKLEFEEKEINLNGLSAYFEDDDPELRRKSIKKNWQFYEDNSAELDTIFDDLIKVRTKIAKKLGHDNFVKLGYDRKERSDYNPEMVEKFRKQVVKYIVPLATKLRERQAKRIGVEKLTFFDEKFMFKTGNPHPKGKPQWIIDNAVKMYSELSDETKVFFDMMIENELMDLDDKQGKASGGYCTYLSKHDYPFIFSNFNGTSHDVKVLTHEAGHAFQKYCSKDYEVLEYIFATSETAEIHSMSMEFLTWPWMNLFFKEDTDKFKFEHLGGAILFIPYGVAVDEFQHIIYEQHDLTPAERHKVWQDLEAKYLPHRDYTDIPYLQKGGFWQRQRHIYKWPFYYIDYTLAQVCAFQFWKMANENREETWKKYLDLCKAGGSDSFLNVIKVADLHSPFDEKCIKSVIHDIEDWLNDFDDSIY